MREQVITHKVGNRSGVASARRGTPASQRPLRRDRDNDGGGIGIRLRALVGYIPSFLKLVLVVIVGLMVVVGYRAAASANFFQVRTVEVQGTSRVAASEVQALVRRDVEKTGVWRADIAGMTARLERMPWVRTAVVSRVLPDGIRVRISERVPRAVARTASGRFRWVDEDAVLLGEMLPSDQLPPFFLRGLDDEDAAATRGENRERVQKFLELQKEWDAAGLSERVSEVSLMDIHDVRAQLAGGDSEIEVRLGSQDQGTRLKKALDVLDGQRQMPHAGLISYIDLSQGRRAIVGLVTGAHATASSDTESAPPAPASEKKPDRELTVNAARESRATRETGSVQSKAKKEREEKVRKQETKSDRTQKVARRN